MTEDSRTTLTPDTTPALATNPVPPEPSRRSRATAATRAKRSAIAAVFGLSAVAMFAGCSAQASPGATGDLEKTEQVAGDEWQHEFDKCMEAAGVDLDAGIPVNADSSGVAPGSSEGGDFGAAQSECTAKLGPAPTAGDVPDDAELTSMMLDLAKCMRAAGYDMPDPKPVDSSSGFSVQPLGVPDADPADVERCNIEAGLTKEMGK